ncbi:MAG: nitroreductase [Rhodovibrionaceae bacterium]
MDALELLLSRQSAPAKLLGEPAPSDADLQPVFEAAVRAPDHGAIRPWRFRIIRGAARERLGDLFVEATRKRAPETPQDKLEEQRGKPLRAPLIIAVLAETFPGHPKVPVVEQLVATGAAAQNMLLALQAMGYGAVLLSGPNAHDPLVKAAFGLQDKDEIVGFLYVGTLREEPREKKRPEAAQFVSTWDGLPKAAQ